MNKVFNDKTVFFNGSVIENIKGGIYRGIENTKVLSANSKTNQDLRCNDDNDLIEKIIVKKDGQIAEIYWLDSLMDVGDKFEENKFKKKVGSSYKTYFDYYKLLIGKSIENAIQKNSDLNYEDFIGDYFYKLNVPEFMITQKLETGTQVLTGYTVTGATAASVIDFSQNNFNEYKKNVVAKMIKEDGDKIAKYYGLKFTADEEYIKGKVSV